jgi:hypothetical protein
MDYTESFQLLPEQSTAAIVVHHPSAKYYVVRAESGLRTADDKNAIRNPQSVIKTSV